MTPAINAAKKAKIDFNIHEYEHDPKSDSYGEEAAEKLGLDTNLVFKTLVVSNEKKELFVAVVPVACQLNFKLLAKVTGSKKISMADKNIAARTTGYVLGGVSPLGQKKKLATVIDESAADFETIFVSAGRRGLEIELAPDDLGKLTRGRFASITK
jgi:Cys-tRNA(Pro)/Cys-tRNA(Cys) deacylase